MINPPYGPKYTSLMYKNITVDSVAYNYNWVKINLEGAKNSTSNGGWSRESNKSAIGARVILTLSDGSIVSREIIAGKGHGSMDALELHYGLGFNGIQDITVRWPSQDIELGQQKVSIFNGPFEVNQSYKIVEDLGFVGLKGDLNLDLEINILDVMILINYVLNEPDISNEILWAADINYSDALNILDITKLVYFVLFH